MRGIIMKWLLAIDNWLEGSSLRIILCLMVCEPEAKGIRIALPNHLGCQTEGICFYNDLKCFISAETSPTSSTRIFTVDFNKWIDRTRP